MIRALFKQTSIELVQGDITEQAVDAIVNAANPSLQGGGGVDGAIHKAAGPGLLQECARLGGCAVGDAKITGGYRLKATHVIHAVGPVYQPNNPQIGFLLASAYQRSLDLAVTHGLRTVAFPSISTGAYNYPLAEAAAIALSSGLDFVVKHPDTLDVVRWVLFNSHAYASYAATLAAMAAQNNSLRLL